MKILIYNSQSHIGGGDTYIKNIFEQFLKKYPQTLLLENGFDWSKFVILLVGRVDGVLLNLSYPRDILVVFLLWMLRIPTINIVHGLWFLESKSMNADLSIFETFYYWLSQYLMCIFSKKTIVVCEYEKKLVIKNFPLIKNRLEIISGAANTEIFKLSKKSKKTIRKEINIRSEIKLLLVVSRIERRKALEQNIYAISHLIKFNPDLILFIIFPSSHFNQMDYFIELLNLIKKLKVGQHVQFLTGLSENELICYYQAADLFLMSSKDLENFSLSVIESLSCGCPVITFNTGGTPELIKQINSELIIADYSALALAKRIEWYFSTSELLKKNLKKKSAKIARLYSWRKSFEKFEIEMSKLPTNRDKP